jgi:polysaccharide biosynthesis protein PslH
VRCLWLTRRLPYPPFYGGDALYSAGMIEAVAQDPRVLAMTVVCHAESGAAPELSRVSWHLVRSGERSASTSLLARLPAIAHRTVTPAYVAAVTEELEQHQWDVVIVDGLPPAPSVVATESTAKPVVYVAHNHEASVRAGLARSQFALSLARAGYALDAAKTSALESALVMKAGLVSAITDADLRQFSAQGARRLVLLPPGYAGPRVDVRHIGPDTPRRAVMLGSFVWAAKRINLEGALKVLAPRFSAAGIGLTVAGATGPAEVERLQAQFPRVDFVGTVDDVSPILRQARIGVIAEPLGGGFKLKTLDYVFHRVPIAVLRGGAEGAPLVAGTSMIEALDLDQISAEVISAIDDYDLLNAMHEAAYRACESKFSWTDRGHALVSAIAAILEGHSAPRNEELPA